MKIETEEEKQKTKEVSNCINFAQLEAVIRKYEPFISNSRTVPVEWNANTLLRRIFIVIDGGDYTNITRANGLREKVIQLTAKIPRGYE